MTVSPTRSAKQHPVPASVKASVLEPFILSHHSISPRTPGRHPRGNGSNLYSELAATKAERDAALDERLAEASGGSDSDVYLRTVESRQARVNALLEERAERDQEREPAQIEADLEQVWDDLTLEDQRRVLHSVFDSVFVWRTSDSGRNGKLPIAERTRLFLAGVGPPIPIRGQRGTIRTLPLNAQAPASKPIDLVRRG